MITLCVIAYVIISLLISVDRMQDDYTLFGDLIKGKEPKPALIEGFLTLPAIAVGLLMSTCILWLILKMFLGVIWVFVWIYHNMP